MMNNEKIAKLAKFDEMDISQVLSKAWEQGIHCFVVFGKCNPFDGD